MESCCLRPTRLSELILRVKETAQQLTVLTTLAGAPAQFQDPHQVSQDHLLTLALGCLMPSASKAVYMNMVLKNLMQVYVCEYKSNLF